MRSGDRLSNIYEMYAAELNYNHEEPANAIRLKYAKKALKEVAPVIFSAGATIGCIAGMYGQSVKIEKGLLACLAAFPASMVTCTDDYPDISVKPKRNQIVVREYHTKTQFVTTRRAIERAEARANKKLQNNYIVRLSSVMHSLGTDVPDYAYHLGWEMDNEIQMDKWKVYGGPFISINIDEQPTIVDGVEVYDLYFKVLPEWLED